MLYWDSAIWNLSMILCSKIAMLAVSKRATKGLYLVKCHTGHILVILCSGAAKHYHVAWSQANFVHHQTHMTSQFHPSRQLDIQLRIEAAAFPYAIAGTCS